MLCVQFTDVALATFTPEERSVITTIAPDVLRWTVNPHLDIARVAQEHLAQAFAHEAFHAARFRRLGVEAGARSWPEIAIGEGLATVYARDYASANEPWAAYDEGLIGFWADELFNQPVDMITLRQWKFQHPDGREWVAYRVGTWLVDTAMRLTGRHAADLVWVPAAVILRSITTTEPIPPLPQ